MSVAKFKVDDKLMVTIPGPYYKGAWGIVVKVVQPEDRTNLFADLKINRTAMYCIKLMGADDLNDGVELGEVYAFFERELDYID